MNRLASLILVSGLVACGGSSKPDTVASTGNPCAANPCAANPCGDNPCGDNPCGAAANPCEGAATPAVDWTAWQSWTKVNKETFVSKGHKKPWVDVYVSNLDAYKAGGEQAEGFAVVKAVHKDDGGKPGAVEMLTGMAKMGSDYDPDNGNWYYAAISADGTKIMNGGKIEMCIGCHTSGDDYLFASKTTIH